MFGIREIHSEAASDVGMFLHYWLAFFVESHLAFVLVLCSVGGFTSHRVYVRVL